MYCKSSCFIIQSALTYRGTHYIYIALYICIYHALYICIYRNAVGCVELTTCNGSFALCALSSPALSPWTEGSGALNQTGCSGPLWWKCFTWWDTHLEKKKKETSREENTPSVDEFQRDVQSLSHLFWAITIALVTKATITSDPIAPSSGLSQEWPGTGGFQKVAKAQSLSLYLMLQ